MFLQYSEFSGLICFYVTRKPSWPKGKRATA